MVGGLILVPITLFNCDHAFVSHMVPRVDGRGASDAVPHTRDGAGCHTGGLTLSLVCKSTATQQVDNYK